MDFTWLGIQFCICWSQKSRGVDQKTCQYLMWPPFAWCSVTNLLHIELIRLLIVARGMLSHSASMGVRSCWKLLGTGTRCRTRPSRTSQTCSMGDMSGEYTGNGRNLNFFQLPVIVTDPWDMGLLSCWNMRWWRRMNGMTMGLRISSRYLHAFKLPSIKCNCVYCP